MATLRDDFVQKIELKQYQEFPKQSILSASSKTEVDAEYAEEIDEDKDLQMKESSRGKVEGSVSLDYFLAGARRRVLIFLVLFLVISQMLASCVDYWASIW